MPTAILEKRAAYDSLERELGMDLIARRETIRLVVPKRIHAD